MASSLNDYKLRDNQFTCRLRYSVYTIIKLWHPVYTIADSAVSSLHDCRLYLVLTSLVSGTQFTRCSWWYLAYMSILPFVNCGIQFTRQFFMIVMLLMIIWSTKWDTLLYIIIIYQSQSSVKSLRRRCEIPEYKGLVSTDYRERGSNTRSVYPTQDTSRMKTVKVK